MMTTLLLLGLLLAGTQGASPMTSNYGQTTYAIPFSAEVPSLGVGSPLDDDFNAVRPQATLSGSPIPPYVALAEKWKTYDPDDKEAFAAIDPRVGAAFMNNSGVSKTWAGRYQSLPLPGIGEQVSHGIYLRALPCFLEGDPTADIGPVLYGLILGNSMDSDPEASAVLFCGATLQRRANIDDSVPETTGYVGASIFALFDGVNQQQGRADLEATYFRALLTQTQPSAGVYDVSIAMHVGTNGQDWLPVYASELTGLPFAEVIKEAGFGLNSFEASDGFAAYFNLFRVQTQTVGDLTKTIGGFQQLGAV